MRFVGASTIVLALISSAAAQAPPSFEAASVKRNTTNGAGLPPIVLVQSGRLRAPFSTLRDLMQAAYGVEPNQIIGHQQCCGRCLPTVSGWSRARRDASCRCCSSMRQAGSDLTFQWPVPNVKR